MVDEAHGTGALGPGIAEENIQARIRGNIVMALSNKFGWLVITTGNKSEMSVGYCTLYGDMVGALAVIGDVVKTEVYRLCRYVNRECAVIPPAMSGPTLRGGRAATSPAFAPLLARAVSRRYTASFNPAPRANTFSAS